MYASTPSKLGPEEAAFNPRMSVRDSYYILRPETLESMYILWRVTQKQKYRDWAWEIFEAIETHCRVEEGGYAGVHNVGEEKPKKINKQESFFLAETLKYLYLIFDDDSKINLNDFVFNTEAHPFRFEFSKTPTAS